MDFERDGFWIIDLIRPAFLSTTVNKHVLANLNVCYISCQFNQNLWRIGMKTLYLIGGTMGVGKTTISRQLKKDLHNSVFWTVTGVGMPIRFS